MKKRCCLTLLMGLLFFSGQSFAQDAAADEMMKKWAEAMTPNEHHEFLSQMAGEWTYENKSYMEGAEPTVTNGQCSQKMLMGGRYLQGMHKGTSYGMPFEGQNTFAYNNQTKVYETSWMDNMGTAMMRGNGTREGNVITIHATYPGLEPGETYRYRMTYEVKSKDSHIHKMWMLGAKEGEEQLLMEITYTRKK